EAVSTPELNIKVSEGEQHLIIKKLQKTAKFETSTSISNIDGLRVEYSDGFGLVRASNTTPVLVLRFEAETQTALERIKSEFRKILSSVVKETGF
ncbi:MAG: phosphomannomutase/phosphoglucomutase, partial [Burkholderiales bacterium]|nr:phosphomannomutase/phosphoglucomutase [Burkholderiales bacterium]